MTLNPKQFVPWEKEAPVRELHDEHKSEYRRLVALHQINNMPADATWPRYNGAGSSHLAHEGIVARGSLDTLGRIEAEMRSRGRGVPLHNLGNLHKHVENVDYPVAPHMARYRDEAIKKRKQG